MVQIKVFTNLESYTLLSVNPVEKSFLLELAEKAIYYNPAKSASNWIRTYENLTLGRSVLGTEQYIEINVANRYVFINYYESSKLLFSGGVEYFKEWIEKNSPSKYIGKVVEFSYKGGSKAGQQRLVRVEQANNDYIEGIDIEEINATDGVSKAYRRYLISNIFNGTNGITVLN